MCKKRHVLDILRDSLEDKQSGGYSVENEVRYKLIIDPSEDDSLVRLLFLNGILDRQRTHVLVCSSMPGDNNAQKVSWKESVLLPCNMYILSQIDIIASIIHSASAGHTIVLAETDDIHESLYDLFNQHFRRIDDPKLGTRFYTNIAIGAHSKLCRVHSDFQCIVILKKTEVPHTPPPFLNRFEKFYFTHQSLLEENLRIMPPCLSIVMQAVKEKVYE